MFEHRKRKYKIWTIITIHHERKKLLLVFLCNTVIIQIVLMMMMTKEVSRHIASHITFYLCLTIRLMSEKGQGTRRFRGFPALCWPQIFFRSSVLGVFSMNVHHRGDQTWHCSWYPRLPKQFDLPLLTFLCTLREYVTRILVNDYVCSKNSGVSCHMSSGQQFPQNKLFTCSVAHVLSLAKFNKPSSHVTTNY